MSEPVIFWKILLNIQKNGPVGAFLGQAGSLQPLKYMLQNSRLKTSSCILYFTQIDSKLSILSNMSKEQIKPCWENPKSEN